MKHPKEELKNLGNRGYVLMTITLYFQGFSFSIMACDNNYYVCKQTPNTIFDEKMSLDMILASFSPFSAFIWQSYKRMCVFSIILWMKNYFQLLNLEL